MWCCAVRGQNHKTVQKDLKFHTILSNHTPFHTNGRHFWLKALRGDDWNNNQIINPDLSAHFISGELIFNQLVGCDMQQF